MGFLVVFGRLEVVDLLVVVVVVELVGRGIRIGDFVAEGLTEDKDN